MDWDGWNEIWIAYAFRWPLVYWMDWLTDEMANLATEIKNLWDNYPKAPKALIASKTARDAAIQAFLVNLQANAKEDDKVLKDFVYAVSAVIFDQFNEGKAAETARLQLVTDLNGVASQTPSMWETYRKHAVDSLTTASSGSIDVNKVAAHYQLDNGLLTTNAANELAYVTRLQKHIQDHLVKDDDVPMTPPKDFVHHLLYLYLYGSRNHYDTVMAPFEPIRSTPRVSSLLQDEWNLLCAFPKDRFMTADVYYSLFQPIGTAVDAFIKAQTGTANSLPALTPPGAPPAGNAPVNPPAPVVNPPAGNVPAPAANVPAAAAVPVVPVPPAPLPLALTPEQQSLRKKVDEIKKLAGDDNLMIGIFETRVTTKEAELKAAVSTKTVADLDKIREAISKTSVFLPNTKLINRIDAWLSTNQRLESAVPPPPVSQQADLQIIYNDVKKMYEEQTTGIIDRAKNANARLQALEAQAVAELSAVGQAAVDPVIARLEAIKTTVQGEAKAAKTEYDLAEAEYRKYVLSPAKYRVKTDLEKEVTDLKTLKSAIDGHAKTTLDNQTDAKKELVSLKALEQRKSSWWPFVGPVALTKADAIKKQIYGFKADVDKQVQEIDALIAKVSSERLGIEEAKIQFKAPPPDPKKFKDERIDQCNVWYHMFDADRLARSDAYRLAHLKAHPDQPWAINFDSDVDVIQVLEAAVKTGKSNRMMDLKDKANFYKMVENLVMATCEELKMAPPQPNSLDEQMLLFVATGASLYDGVLWAYANDSINAWKFTRMHRLIQLRVDPKSNKINIAGTNMNLLTKSRHSSQSTKASKVISQYEEAY